SSLFVSAQNHAGVQTPSLFSTLEMPAPHNDSIALLSSSTQPYVFAYPLNVSLSVADVAAVFFTDSTVEYRLCITSPNAVSLNLIFSDFYLPENASLFLFSKDSVSFFGPFTNTHTSYSGVFATPIVDGSALYVLLSVPIRNVDSMRAVI